MKVSTREKKILYTGIVIAVLILIYYAATEFMPGDGESIADKVDLQEKLLVRQKELVGYKGYYEKRIEDAEDEIGKIQKRLLPANSTSAAGTELRRLLTDFASESGVAIMTTSNMPDRKVDDSDSLIKVSVRIAVQSSLEDLVHFLSSIRNHDRFLKVEEMAINTNIVTVANIQRRQIRPPLNLVISGYVNVPPPDEPAAKHGENGTQKAAAR